MTKRRSPGPRRAPALPGRVRIVAGKWRGRLLPVCDEPELRPTPERIRETLFNWLAPRIEGARCLDLFAGTGVLGLEALSRGAAAVFFIERSASAAGALQKSIAALGAEGAVVHAGDAFGYLQNNKQQAMDIVFLDPPYALESLTELCRLLQVNSWLAKGASIYMEQDRGDERPVLPDGFTVVREKTAGSVRYSLVMTPANSED
ncbi:MAG: 16S rRNA (guanine(966)-N(2))-methyltransferase RsmD [Woeseia sp.]